MIPLRIITYFQNDEPLKWGVKLIDINTPLCIVVNSNVANLYQNLEINANTEILVLDIETPLFLIDTLKIIAFANANSEYKAYNSFYIDDTFLYQNISLQLFYSPILVDYILSKNYIGYIFNAYYHYDAWLYTISNINVQLLINELKANEGYFGNKNDEIIKKYIQVFEKTHTDFNLQATELMNESVLHIIGDSHVFNTLTPNDIIACRSNILYQSNLYFENFIAEFIYTHHLGSRTLYGFCHDEQDINQFLIDLCVKTNDICLFVLGEIDIRSHVFKYVNEDKSYHQIIDELIKKYTKKLIEVRNTLNTSIVVMGVIPPMNGPNYTSEDYPIRGSLEQRVEATLYFNSKLNEISKVNGFTYFEVNHFYALPDGSLNLEFSDLFCHVNSYYNYFALNLMAQSLNSQAYFKHHELAI